MFLVKKKVKHEISILPCNSRYFCSVDNKHYFHIFQNITSCMWRVVLFKLLYRLFILTVGLAEIIPLGYFRFYSCQNGSIIREETVVSFLGYTKYTYSNHLGLSVRTSLEKQVTCSISFQSQPM